MFLELREQFEVPQSSKEHSIKEALKGRISNVFRIARAIRSTTEVESNMIHACMKMDEFATRKT